MNNYSTQMENIIEVELSEILNLKTIQKIESWVSYSRRTAENYITTEKKDQ